jgi:ribosome biogenesis GTPase / thiamine phosphate phosphatase
MPSRGNRGNWFEAKRNHPRAVRNRERRRIKYGAPSDDELPAGEDFLNSPAMAADGARDTHQTAIVAQITGKTIDLLRDGTFQTFTPADLGLARPTEVSIGDEMDLEMDGDSVISASLLPRRSELARFRFDSTRRSGVGEVAVLAANVDVGAITISATKYNSRLIDRYLIVCEYGNIDPLLVVNKIDKSDLPEQVKTYEQLGIRVLGTSATEGNGMDRLRQELTGKTAVFTGPSGVGKSSLINKLVGNEDLAVSAVREGDQRGRHTTSRSQLIEFAPHSFVIDTPGIRALGLLESDPRIIRNYFPEFQEYQMYCRYRDCTHTHEPGCAVREAVSDGRIDAARYKSYLHIVEA